MASVFQPFISRLEQQMNVSAEGEFPVPIAVVVTKMGAMSKTPWSSMAQKRAGLRRQLMPSRTT